jgi:hypothetical protein
MGRDNWTDGIVIHVSSHISHASDSSKVGRNKQLRASPALVTYSTPKANVHIFLHEWMGQPASK